MVFFFFFQAEDGIRDVAVTGVQTCALPIYPLSKLRWPLDPGAPVRTPSRLAGAACGGGGIGRAAGRGRGEILGGAVSLKKKKKKVDVVRGMEKTIGQRQTTEEVRTRYHRRP